MQDTLILYQDIFVDVKWDYGLVIYVKFLLPVNHILSLQVLQRKTEEAARATKKLKELLEARKITARRETIGNNHPN